MKHIVKRAGHTEEYDARKLYSSVYSCARAVREPVGTAELIAADVVDYVEDWLKPKHEVTSNDIRRRVTEELKVINPAAAYQYLHHRVVW